MLRLGVDLGGTNIKVGIVDADYNIVASKSVKTGAGRAWTEIVSDITDTCRSVCSENCISYDWIGHVGVGTPGAVEPGTGLILFANNLCFHHVPLKAELSKLLERPVSVANDANVAALGEVLAGGAKGFQKAVAITLGTGVGGGIVLGGKIYDGFNGAGGELGHMVIQIDGEPCTCGRKGCWESYASATALIRQTRAVMENIAGTALWAVAGGNLESVTARTAFDAAKQGDRAALGIVDKYITYIATGLANIINIIQPEIVLVGGGVCGEGEYLLAPLRERTYKNCYASGDNLPLPKVERAVLGNNAGIIGAAFLA